MISAECSILEAVALMSQATRASDAMARYEVPRDDHHAVADPSRVRGDLRRGACARWAIWPTSTV